MSALFASFKLGTLELKNRVVMAPLTRSRAENNLATDLMAKYYSDRATAGLIITEGVSPSPNGLGYARIPGLYNQTQVEAWKKVTSAVHAKGGRIFVQLMHTGRVSHPLNIPANARIMAPSAFTLEGEMWTDQSGMKAYVKPEAMSASDIEATINEYVRSAELAIQAGFDGVEIHGANGYMIDQFLNTASNQRTDEWGGSLQGRMRFALEIARRTVKAIGADKVGIRLSPFGAFNGMRPDQDMPALYTELAKALSQLNLVYIHIVDHSSMGAPPVSAELKAKIRDNFKGAYILSGGYDLEKANHDLEEQKGDLVAFGRPFISNPNLVEKLKSGKTLTAADPNTFYTPGERGYTDYPA